MDTSENEVALYYALDEFITDCMIFLTMLMLVYKDIVKRGNRRIRRRTISYNMGERIPAQISHLHRIIKFGDVQCIVNLRMSRDAFARLCYLLENVGGLVHSRYSRIDEKVAMFLSILAHHKKNRIIGHDYIRSGYTVSKNFHDVLRCVLRLHPILISPPSPVTEDCSSEKWKIFKGCLGALDGTYIGVQVPNLDKPKYRNRKGETSVNVLGVCDRDMKFTYVLTGWEGSAADSSVLRDAIGRPNGLKIPRGFYYLCDCGYANAEGFLTPYRKVRYHLNEWGRRSMAPQNYREYFNFKHASARNVIERAFGLLKKRWAVLRSPSFYGIKTHNQMIMACVLLHNFIRSEMVVDPLEDEVEETMENDEAGIEEIIDNVETSTYWDNWRENLAMTMYNQSLGFH